MALEDALVLPSDVEIVSVTRLTQAIRAGLDCADDEFVVTRRNSRGGSHVVDARAAALLQVFRLPTRIADAVHAFSRLEGHPADEILEDIYPFLFRLWSERLLVPSDRPEVAPIESHFQEGDRIEGYRILRCIQALDDTEVFLGRHDGGSFVAIKAARLPSDAVDQRLEHEATILLKVGPARAPRLAGLFHADERGLLITEWINGVDVSTYARKVRTGFQRGHGGDLLRLCHEIGTALADVHAAGVVHGDIHGHNLIVERSGRIRLIDFGLAQDLTEPQANVPRGGVPFYFEPEYAQGQLQATEVPLTPAGEQYAVAVLLYQLWTGTPHLDWRLERSEMLRQILDASPLAFEARRAPPWPALETVIGRALSKDPSSRYKSMSDFAAALDALTPEAAAHENAFGRRHQKGGRSLADELIRRCEIGARDRPSSSAGAPVASLAYGSAGVAYGLYRIAQSRRNPRLIALADLWTQNAYTQAAETNAFLSDELDITHEAVGDVSLLHSLAGIHFVQALISASVGDAETMDRALAALVEHSQRRCPNPDLTLGTGSLLLALSEIIESLPASGSLARDLARRRGDELARHLESVLRTENMSTSKLVPALGVAHGWAGLLYVLLRWRMSTNMPTDEIVKERLDELREWAQPHAGGLRWPVHNRVGPVDFLDGWCNGTAGHTMLFELAHRTLEDDEYAEIAIRAAEAAQMTDTELGTLCCGLAGIGYASLSAYRITGDKIWRQRAELLAQRAANCTSDLFYDGSLYKGAVGVAVLEEELSECDHAAMPVFEPVA
jgi:hypothetical protein